MSFRISGLSPDPFRPLFGLNDEDLAAKSASRVTADESLGFPDRIEMRDPEPGETLILLNYEHLPGQSPYRSRHAIFVREGAEQRYDRLDEIPDVLRRRLISLRAFSAADMMLHADVVDGQDLADLIGRFFDNPQTTYLHAHNAKYGCYAGRIDRA